MRLIDADLMIFAVNTLEKKCKKRFKFLDWDGLRYLIGKCPTAEAPIIRCKDCSYFKFGDYCTHPIIEHAMCRESDYCSHAVKKNVCQSE